MNPPPSPRPRRRLGWILLPALLVAVFLVVMITGRGDLPGFEARVAALRAAGQPVIHADLPGSTPPSPELATGIFLLDQALERLNNRLTAPGNGPYWNKPDSPHHAFLQETEPLRRELHRLLAPDPVLRSLHEARSHPGGPISFSQGMTLSVGVLNIELWLLASSTHNLQQGQIDNAVDCLTEAVRLRTIPRPVRGSMLWAFDAGTYTSDSTIAPPASPSTPTRTNSEHWNGSVTPRCSQNSKSARPGSSPSPVRCVNSTSVPHPSCAKEPS